MSLVARYTSVKEILEKVYRDTDYQQEIAHEDLIQWVIEAMDLIGYPLTYVPKIMGHKENTAYDFTNYRIELPCDFHTLQAIAVDGYPAYPATNQFHELMDGACCGFDNISPELQDIFYEDYVGELISIGPYSPQALPLNNPSSTNSQVTFTMNNNYVTFNVETGKACIAYFAFPVDNEGFPIVPDDTKYKMAVTKYLIMKIDYRLWRNGFISDKVYQESKDEWMWYCGSSSSHLKIPSLHQMETLKLSLTRLIPRFNSYATFFKNLNTGTDRL